ncbi:MAG: DUF2273 domain-containing protein [Clostridia bacterium]|nr:DUF2273 domain-containing protein [Clostridia bacterium]MBR4459014.1 DUF2273 domain-containing protein [Clostridia bacterium]
MEKRAADVSVDEEERLEAVSPDDETDEEWDEEEEEPCRELTTRPDPAEEKDTKQNLFLQYRKILIGAALGAIVACLIMWLGFWRVFFVCMMAGFGAFLFGAENKKDIIRRIVNRIFPSRK